MSALRPGIEVEITDGDARGRRGKLVELAKVTFDGIPVWCIDTVSIAGLRITRSIRADWIRPVAEVAS